MLACRITMLRHSLGMSQKELAQKLHISASAEGMYEQGRRTPSIDTLIQMAKTFSVSLDYLLTGEEYVFSDLDDTPGWKYPPCGRCFCSNPGHKRN